jgi:hypothetical protein
VLIDHVRAKRSDLSSIVYRLSSIVYRIASHRLIQHVQVTKSLVSSEDCRAMIANLRVGCEL